MASFCVSYHISQACLLYHPDKRLTVFSLILDQIFLSCFSFVQRLALTAFPNVM